MAGSGISAKPFEAMEVSIEGLSLNLKSTTSRALPACSSAETMARAVCAKSRSAVISGPRSARDSTVRRSRRKLLFCTATRERRQKNPEQKKSTTRMLQEDDEVCWLVWCSCSARGNFLVSATDLTLCCETHQAFAAPWKSGASAPRKAHEITLALAPARVPRGICRFARNAPSTPRTSPPQAIGSAAGQSPALHARESRYPRGEQRRH